MNMSHLRLPTLLAVCCSVVAVPAARAQEVEWRFDYNRARQEAEAKSRPLMIDFGTEACFWCKQLDTRTFSDPEVRRAAQRALYPAQGRRRPPRRAGREAEHPHLPDARLRFRRGPILGLQEGFVEAPELKEHLTRTLMAVATPEWMARDFRRRAQAAAPMNTPRREPAQEHRRGRQGAAGAGSRPPAARRHRGPGDQQARRGPQSPRPGANAPGRGDADQPLEAVPRHPGRA